MTAVEMILKNVNPALQSLVVGFANDMMREFPDTFMDNEHTKAQICTKIRPIAPEFAEATQVMHAAQISLLKQTLMEELKKDQDIVKDNHREEEIRIVDCAWVDVLKHRCNISEILSMTVPERKKLVGFEEYKFMIENIRKERLKIMQLFRTMENDIYENQQTKFNQESNRLKSLFFKEIRSIIKQTTINLAARMVISWVFTAFPVRMGLFFNFEEIAEVILQKTINNTDQNEISDNMKFIKYLNYSDYMMDSAMNTKYIDMRTSKSFTDTQINNLNALFFPSMNRHITLRLPSTIVQDTPAGPTVSNPGVPSYGLNEQDEKYAETEAFEMEGYTPQPRDLRDTIGAIDAIPWGAMEVLEGLNPHVGPFIPGTASKFTEHTQSPILRMLSSLDRVLNNI